MSYGFLNEKMYSPKEVATILQLSQSQVWRLLEEGKIRSINLGRRTKRVCERDIQEFLNSRYNGELNQKEETEEKLKQSSETFYTTKEAALILNVSHAVVWNLVKNGEMKSCRFGAKTLLIKQSDLNDYIKKKALLKKEKLEAKPPVKIRIQISDDLYRKIVHLLKKERARGSTIYSKFFTQAVEFYLAHHENKDS
jgi:excisionase family DNA binding protein